ncbi:TPA: hypothetical protein NG615_000673 [Vibrio parahaemolyticus]|nr:MULTISPECIES: hypothetical protein [Vibrio]MDF5276953.1 hypothetical protein [Vibrio parahaemolyticus]MDW1736744.1 hypothetical protein [Vibrio sp. Vb2235]MDW1789056.1 hypothetical protein [Vibrio sp. Vb2227]MDW1818651.1 hypothetical protein [Vibrio sp. Vb2232]MDW2071951.1 hypothetical protein [Vibrio sp. 2096]
MENLQDKYTRALNNFEPEQRSKFLELVESALHEFKQNLDCAASELGVDIIQKPILLPFGSSLAKSKMRLIFYIKSEQFMQPLKIDVALTSYLYKQEEQRNLYLKNVISRYIDRELKIGNKPKHKPLHVRFNEMLTTFRKGAAIKPNHLETLSKVNKIVRNHSLKVFGKSNTEPTIWDYFYSTKISLNEVVNIIKDAE